MFDIDNYTKKVKEQIKLRYAITVREIALNYLTKLQFAKELGLPYQDNETAYKVTLEILEKLENLKCE